jgi:hypothetical protein
MADIDERFTPIQGLLDSRSPAGKTGHPSPASPARRPDLTEAPGFGPAAQLPKLPPRRPPTGGDKPTTGRSSISKGGTRRVALRLPDQLHARLVRRVELDGSSQGHVVLDAIEHAHTQGRLGDLIARSAPAQLQGALFDRTRLRGRAEPSVPVELRLRASALEQVDRLAAEHGAESRTQLVVAALAAYLTEEGVAEVAGAALRDVSNGGR